METWLDKILILEGPSGSGKTAFGQYLSERLGVPYVKIEFEDEHLLPGGSEGIAFRYRLSLARGILDAIIQVGAPAILDRSYPSELVYSRLDGRDIDEDLWRRLDAYIASTNMILLVICTKHPENITEELREYTGVISMSKIGRILHIDMSSEDVEVEFKQLEKLARRAVDEDCSD